jgi:hypothetical protein
MITDLLDVWYLLIGLGLVLSPIVGLSWGYVEKVRLRRLRARTAEQLALADRLEREDN